MLVFCLLAIAARRARQTTTNRGSQPKFGFLPEAGRGGTAFEGGVRGADGFCGIVWYSAIPRFEHRTRMGRTA